MSETERMKSIILDKICIKDLARNVETELVKPENRLLKDRFKQIYRYEKRFFTLVIRKILLRKESYYLRHVRESKGFPYIHRNMFFGDLYCLNFATHLLLSHENISQYIDEICEIENKQCNTNLEIIAKQINEDQKKLQDAYMKQQYSILSFFTPDAILFDKEEVVLARKEYTKSRIKHYMYKLDAPGQGSSYSEMVAAVYDKERYYVMLEERINFAEKMFSASMKNISKTVDLKEGDRVRAELTLSKEITTKILRKRKYEQIIEKRTADHESIFANM